MSNIFHVSPSSGVPIYRQLLEQLERMILSGQIKPGELLPSVRSVAAQIEVNPMTISKAYGLLEERALIIRQRGKGMVVAERNEELSNKEKNKMLMPLIKELVSQARQLDIQPEQLIKMLEESIKE